MWNLFKSVVFVSCELTLLGCLMGLLFPSLMTVSNSHRRKLGRLLTLAPMSAFILAAAVSVSRQETASAQSKETLASQVQAGAAVLIRFEPEACVVFDLGSIECGQAYHGSYDRSLNRWRITGPQKSGESQFTGESSNADRLPGAISFWGLLARFDQNGSLFYSGQEVGTLRIAPLGLGKAM